MFCIWLNLFWDDHIDLRYALETVMALLFGFLFRHHVDLFRGKVHERGGSQQRRCLLNDSLMLLFRIIRRTCKEWDVFLVTFMVILHIRECNRGFITAETAA